MSKILIKTAEQIEGIRRSGRIASRCLDYISGEIYDGVSTLELDKKIESFLRDHGAIPATLGYNGFPASSCISPNDVVCHGIPSKDIVLKEGDIFNIDVTAILDGYFGDTSRMYSIGEISRRAKDLIEATEHAMHLGIEQVKPGGYFGDIGFFIARYIRARKYSVVYEYCGHGVGIEFHEEPHVEHSVKKPKTGAKFLPGMVFTIEPMINEGVARTVLDKNDGWTARTYDGKLSAQFEHTVLVTDTGVELLTVS
ncbi:MAG: type I methionyl aminopeptidase [Bacteroidales bacterium]